jgi:hypothetical protein
MYKYIGDGWIHGIPARDLSEDEFYKLTKEQQEEIKKSPLYQLEKKQKVVKGDQES